MKDIAVSRFEMPSKEVYSYALQLKNKYPKVWAKGGNIFGNTAFKNLEKVIKRGHWVESERWMYNKWQSFIARHQHDNRIAGIIANVKWLVFPNIGATKSKQIINQEIEKYYGRR